MKKEKFSRFKSFISYTGILSFLFLSSKDDFLNFHAKQGRIILFLGVIALIIPLGIFLIWPFLFICAFTGAFKALDNKKWKIPLVWNIPIIKNMLK